MRQLQRTNLLKLILKKFHMAVSKLPFAEYHFARTRIYLRSSGLSEPAIQAAIPHIVGDFNDTKISMHRKDTGDDDLATQKYTVELESPTVSRVREVSNDTTHYQATHDSPPLNRALGDHRPHESDGYSHESMYHRAAEDKACINSFTYRQECLRANRSARRSREFHHSSTGQVSFDPYSSHLEA